MQKKIVRFASLSELQDLASRETLHLPFDRGHGTIALFEDPFYSFFHTIFPYLKKNGVRVLLGVSPRYIIDETTISPETRLEVPKTLAFQDEFFESKAPFCTWKELYEMVRSGLVEVASHSFSKKNLTHSFVSLACEIDESKQILENKLPQAISTFIVPFGKSNKNIDAYITKHHSFMIKRNSFIA